VRPDYRLGVLVALLLVSTNAAAQNFEAGIHVTGLHFHKIDEGPAGIGGRFHYNVRPLIGADAELTHYPSNSAGNFGETAALLGVRIGARVNRVGLFAKARPGVMHFGGDYFKTRLDDRTHFIMDVGGMVQYYFQHRVIVRLEFGDTTIYYGGAKLFNRPNPDALGTVHNFQSGLGLALRF